MSKPDIAYTVLWAFWVLSFLAIEGSAFWHSGDTFSERVWKWANVKDQPKWGWKRIMLIGFLSWLLFHLGFGWFTSSNIFPWK